MRADPEITKKEILDTAKDLFVRKGLSKTTARDIAAKSGVAETSIYRLFRADRERGIDAVGSVCITLVKEGLSRLKDYTQQAIKDIENPKERLRNLVIATMHWLLEIDPNVGMILVHEIVSFREITKEVISSKEYNHWLSLIDQTIEEEKKQTIFRPADIKTDLLREAILGLVERWTKTNILARRNGQECHLRQIQSEQLKLFGSVLDSITTESN